MSEVVDTDFTANLALAMYQSSKEKTYTDFKIRAGSRTIMCHRVVICASSDYFKTLCKTGITEATVDNAILTEGDGEILEAVVKYLYLGSSTITASNVQGMVVAGDFVTLPRLISKCEEFMINNLNVAKLLPYHQLANKIKLDGLSAACQKLAKDKFNEATTTEWFLSLSVEEVRAYLQADDLQATTEDDVMQALVRWLENCGAGNEDKERYVERLFPCIRLRKCTNSKLGELSKSANVPNPLRLKIFEYLNHGLHSASIEARRLLSTEPGAMAAKSASIKPASAPAAATTATTATSKSTAATAAAATGATPKAGGAAAASTSPTLPQEERVLLVGGYTTGSKVHENAVFLDKPLNDAILTRPPLCVNATYVSVCAAPGGFIVSGGENQTTRSSVSRVRRFSTADLSWSDLPDMLHPRDSHGSVCTNNRFFAAGGCNTEKGSDEKHASVSVMDLDKLAWSECDTLPSAVSQPGVTVIDSDLLVIGGCNDKGQYSTQVCRYDSRTGKRTDCKPTPKPCEPINRTVAVGRYVFVLHYDSRLFMQYDVKANNWCEINLPCQVKVASFSAMVVHKDRIMVTGGYDDSWSIHNLVQTYDINNKTWWLEKQTTPLPLCRHVAIVVRMSRRP